MGESERGDSGINPSRELSEHVKESVAWIKREIRGDAEDVFDLVEDSLRELRNFTNTDDEPPSPELIAEKIEDAGAGYRLARVIYPDGRLSISAQRETFLLYKQMKELGLDPAALKTELEMS